MNIIYTGFEKESSPYFSAIVEGKKIPASVLICISIFFFLHSSLFGHRVLKSPQCRKINVYGTCTDVVIVFDT